MLILPSSVYHANADEAMPTYPGGAGEEGIVIRWCHMGGVLGHTYLDGQLIVSLCRRSDQG